MWQRIQTLYLGIGLGLIVSMFWLELASGMDADGVEVIVKYIDKPIYKVWIIILTVFQFLALGGYKWRMKQFRVVLFTAIACLGFQGYLTYDYFAHRADFGFSWTILFPFVITILDLLAARAIMVDEAIVRSANRLRSTRRK